MNSVQKKKKTAEKTATRINQLQWTMTLLMDTKDVITKAFLNFNSFIKNLQHKILLLDFWDILNVFDKKFKS